MTYPAAWGQIDDGSGGAGQSPGQGVFYPEGQYVGRLLRSELVTSQIKGTPGIRLYFQVDEREVSVDVWITENSAQIAIDTLESLGWNGSYESAEFSKGQGVALYLKHETYKGKSRERWNISNFERKPPPPVTDSNLVRFAARYKQNTAAPPAPPVGAPSVPSVPGRGLHAAPGRSAPTPEPVSRAPARPTPRAVPSAATTDPKLDRYAQMVAAAHDVDSAWAVWEAAGFSEANAAEFWENVEKLGGSSDPAEIPSEKWRLIAGAAPPF